MIHTARQSAKFIMLVRRLRPTFAAAPVDVETIAVGLLERLWHSTMTNAPRGDIGKLSDELLAESVGWFGGCSELVDVLVECGWIDRCSTHRLVVHDWHEHSPRHVKQNIGRKGGFVTAAVKQEPTVSPETLSGDLPSQEHRKALTPNQTKPNVTQPNQTNSHTHSAHAKNEIKIAEGFETEWQRWLDFRESIDGRRPSEIQTDVVLMELGRRGPEKAKRDIEFSIMKNAKSILNSNHDFQNPQTGSGTTKPPPKQMTLTERLKAEGRY